MATRAQAKAKIDSIAIVAKQYIDYMPSTVNIKDGTINFAPDGLVFKLDADGDVALANSWATSIMNNLTAAGLAPVLEPAELKRRADDGIKSITINTALAVYRIFNF